MAYAEDVVMHNVAHGETHEGPLPPLGVEPTNERVEFEGVSIHEMDGDLATEAGWYCDQPSVLTQLGLVPETPTP